LDGDPPQASFVCVPQRTNVKERADGGIDVISMDTHVHTNPKIMFVFLAMDLGFETTETVLTARGRRVVRIGCEANYMWDELKQMIESLVEKA